MLTSNNGKHKQKQGQAEKITEKRIHNIKHKHVATRRYILSKIDTTVSQHNECKF